MNPDGKEHPVRVLIVDDDVVVRLGLISILESLERVEIAGRAADAAEAVDMARRLDPGVVLLGLGAAPEVRLGALLTLAKTCRVLVLTDREDSAADLHVLHVGASGCLVHRRFGADELIGAVIGTADGRASLSPSPISTLAALLKHACSVQLDDSAVLSRAALSNREAEVMNHIARGRSNPDIARILTLSEKTVKNHVNHIYAKLKVRSRAEAVARWVGA